MGGRCPEGPVLQSCFRCGRGRIAGARGRWQELRALWVPSRFPPSLLVADATSSWEGLLLR